MSQSGERKGGYPRAASSRAQPSKPHAVSMSSRNTQQKRPSSSQTRTTTRGTVLDCHQSSTSKGQATTTVVEQQATSKVEGCDDLYKKEMEENVKNREIGSENDPLQIKQDYPLQEMFARLQLIETNQKKCSESHKQLRTRVKVLEECHEEDKSQPGILVACIDQLSKALFYRPREDRTKVLQNSRDNQQHLSIDTSGELGNNKAPCVEHPISELMGIGSELSKQQPHGSRKGNMSITGPCAKELQQFLDCAEGHSDLSACEGLNETYRKCRQRNC